MLSAWCYIGKRKLDAALGVVEDLRVNLIWRPFQRSDTPPDGYDRRKQMEDRFGSDGPASWRTIFSPRRTAESILPSTRLNAHQTR